MTAEKADANATTTTATSLEYARSVLVRQSYPALSDETTFLAKISNLVNNVRDTSQTEVTLSMQTSLTEAAGDSLALLEVLTSLEDDFDHRLTADEVGTIETVGDLFAIFTANEPPCQ